MSVSLIINGDALVLITTAWKIVAKNDASYVSGDAAIKCRQIRIDLFINGIVLSRKPITK